MQNGVYYATGALVIMELIHLESEGLFWLNLLDRLLKPIVRWSAQGMNYTLVHP